MRFATMLTLLVATSLALPSCGSPREARLAPQSTPITSCPTALGPTARSGPRFDRIDYTHPAKYTVLLPSFGKAETILSIAAQVEGATPEQKLRNLSAWVDANLRYDESAAYAWRDVDRMLADGTYRGCADLALLFGAVTRALGLPTVWVKAMDAAWIREFRARGGKVEDWRGHVFLEIFYDGRWVLVDPGPATVQRDYDPRARILPGDRYAYDKGDDPYALVLSMRWDEWRAQTREYFATFDLANLPVPAGSSLFTGGVHVAADRPVWQWLVARCKHLGFDVDASFNTGFDVALPKARGHTLILTVVGEHSVLPSSYWAEYGPVSQEELSRDMKARASGRLDRKLGDGTRVILLFARDLDAMRDEVGKLQIEEP